MGVETVQDWRRTLSSALEWWQDAGVDVLVDEEPRDWLARRAPPAEAMPSPDAVAAPVETLPDTLDAFIAWRMSEAAPEYGWMTPCVRPAGSPDAEWAIFTDMPEPDDTDALLTGPSGRLLDRMLAAVGLSRDSVYIASLATARPLTGRIPSEQQARLVALARHHLGLIAPKKLLILGQATSCVLDETSDAAGFNRIHEINHSGVTMRVLATYHPRWLLDHAAAKQIVWKHLLPFSRETSE
ncbi:uracil-DNA glycosylase [Sphingomonas sp. JC676]|uniref:uracil-DNA glycosylase family protein n=1 Tax=Sphingomonas sp. JC676 TaxID=2768065 RepID=UPI0016576DC3|nr:uracil-DNA glycosylase family protein [Sphingomonas sp. JC676]MBC9031460.1 uracil-DNA glycosylase [Sphingomonas sp. JC676]